MFRITTLLLASAAFAGAMSLAEPLARAEAPAAAVQQTSPAIRVVAVEKRELVETLDVSGSVTPRQEAAVGVDVAGLIVRELNADKGDRVKKGDVLARLDRMALETQLAQVDASKAQAEAAIAQAKAQVSDAEIGVRQAAEALERARTLQLKGVSTQAQLDNAVNAFDSASAATSRSGWRRPRCGRRPTGSCSPATRRWAASSRRPAARCSASPSTASWSSRRRFRKPRWPRCRPA
jgi:HlyD family secretion protein